MLKPWLSSALCVVLIGCASTATPPITEPQRAVPVTPPVETPVLPNAQEKTPSQAKAETGSDQMPALPSAILDFKDLPGWQEGDQRAALGAFVRSCVVFAKGWAKNDKEALAWKPACEAARQVDNRAEAARTFFETYFVPQETVRPKGGEGLLTAYYEPELEVRAEPAPGYDEPIFSRPEDLVTVDPKKFAATGFRGRKLMGRVDEGSLVPYYTRGEIKKKGGKALAWGSPADVFFLQVQGSGRLHFKDGRIMRAAFAGHNGHAYTSIGRILIKEGELDPGKASKGGIEKWMAAAGPEKTSALMNRNARYVFFKAKPVLDTSLGPIGTQGAPLTAGASLAVDPGFYPLGTPIWVATRLPQNDRDWKGQETRFLAIAQDTGGAINGPMRGDLFLGSGAKAGRLAGIVKHAAHWWVLVPRTKASEAMGPKT
ncbi:MAG: MltA domain-containing protein [Robiginitomaculum sp.]|nr:MltA domain-containing protein [Robiginitomaculum sp.]MDQ7078897.1 MltA domain-containing protein [Robiginitomaculum sp.]